METKGKGTIRTGLEGILGSAKALVKRGVRATAQAALLTAATVAPYVYQANVKAQAQNITIPDTNGTIVISPRVMQDNGLYVKVFNNLNYKFDLIVVAENISPNMNVTNVQWELDLPADFPIYGVTPLTSNALVPDGYCENRNFTKDSDFFYPKSKSGPNFVSKTNNARTFFDDSSSPRQAQFQTGTLGIYSLRATTNSLGKRTIGIKNAKAFGPQGEIKVVGTKTSFYVAPDVNYLTNRPILYDDWNNINEKRVPTFTVVVGLPPTLYSPYFIEKAKSLNSPNWEKIATSPTFKTGTRYANFIHTDWGALTNQLYFYRASGTK